MSSGETAERRAEVHVRNLGGISETTVTLGPGVNVLSGRNATNRTSLLRAIMAALGSDDASLKGDADEGEVTLTLDGERYTRRFVRENGTVTTGGDPYLDDPALADLFAFLLETNEARRAVERGGDLRELVMRPVDTEAIQREIDRLREEQADVDRELEALDSLAERAPELEAERSRLDDEIEAKGEALAETEREIEDANADVERRREERAELDDLLDELQNVRSELEEVRFQIESARESVAALRDRREELAASLEETPAVDAAETPAFEEEITRLREQKQSLEATINDLRTVVQFNENRIDDELTGVLQDSERGDGELTDQLVASERVVCWTCGSEVDPDAIESTLETLRELVREKAQERTEVERELRELQDEREEVEARRERRAELEDELAAVESDIDERERRIENRQERRGTLADEVDELESAIEELQDQEYDEILELHREANELEFELEQLEDERDDVEDELAEIDDRLGERDDLEARREQLRDRLADLRTRVEQVETEVVEAFNDQMETVLSLLGYENVERVWIERRQETVREGRQHVERSTFDLHVVRSADDGTTYEDTLDHVSESEREVTGLVFALAGYLVHDVHETLPFVLLDSLEAIDSERIAALVDHFAEFGEYLVVALLPEDTRAVSEEHRRVTEI